MDRPAQSAVASGPVRSPCGQRHLRQVALAIGHARGGLRDRGPRAQEWRPVAPRSITLAASGHGPRTSPTPALSVQKKRRGEEESGKKDISSLFSLLLSQKLIFYGAEYPGKNLTTTKVSTNKSLHFQCPPAKGVTFSVQEQILPSKNGISSHNGEQ